MKIITLGLVLVVIGMIALIITHTSIICFDAYEYIKLGIASSVVQLIGVVLIAVDRN